MALSDDLRERVVGAVVEGGMSRNAAVKEEAEDVELAAPPGVDVVSLEEVEAAEEKVLETAGDDIIEDDPADATDDPFLEEKEEDDDDVTNLIDGDIAPDEEP